MIYSLENIKGTRVNKLFTLISSVMMVGIFLIPTKVSATHIVGGEMTYRCIANWTFEVTLTVRRDCEYGSNEAQFDQHASVGIYDSSGELLPWLGVGGQLLIPYNDDDTLNSILTAKCDFIGDEVCVHTSVYRDTITLPFRPGGYILAYHRCCRNETLTNITDPLETGSIYSIELSNTASIECNNSPVFNAAPELYICANEELVADMSATDTDGDSLVYKLCTPYSGASFDFPMPQPEYDFRPNEVNWKEPFSLGNLMGGDPLRIDPNTGILTGTPNLVGQFLVGVCVEEYRDGKLISTVRRDFQYNVRECIDGPSASFTVENDPECDGLEVAFTNTSENTDLYEWYFDFPNTDPNLKSFEENPVFTFPADGIYTVKLIATRSSDGCFDEFIRNIGVYDSQLEASFDFKVEGCEEDSSIVTFTSTATEPLEGHEVASTLWSITNGDDFTVDTSASEFTITVPRIDEIAVSLYVLSTTGCDVTLDTVVDSDPVELELVADIIKVCAGEPTPLILNGNPEWTYTWEPEEGLDFGDPEDRSNPTYTLAEGEGMAIFNVTVTDGSCSKTGEVVIMETDNPLPDPFDFDWDLDCGTTTVCFTNTSVPLDGSYIFDFGDPSTEDDMSSSDTVCYTYPDFGTYIVSLEYTATCEEGNIITKEISVTPDLTISLPESMMYCKGEEVTINIETDQDNVNVVWSDQNGNNIGEGTEVTFNPEGDITVTAIATNAGRCMDTASVTLNEYDFDYSIERPDVACVNEDFTITLIDNAGDNLSFMWEPSDVISSGGSTNEIVANISSETIFIVKIINEDNGCMKMDTVNMPISEVSAEIISDPEEVYQCNPAEISVVDQNPNWTYEWNTGDTGPSFTSDTLLETTSFSVTVTDEYGCTATATKSVTVLLPQCDETDVFLPTGFTPNGDGVNDILKVESNFIKQMRLVIYDRWGKIVFETTNKDEGWDGTFNGSDLAPDVYAFVLQVTCSNGVEYGTQGNVTLIR